MTEYLPEGQLINNPENRERQRTPAALREACERGNVLEARVTLCDAGHNLHVDLGCMNGVIERDEGALGISDGSVRDIALISRVNKPVMFRIIGFREGEAVLSRKSVQESCIEEYISALDIGDVVPARVTHLDNFGAFCDIGAGVSALLPIDSISVSRIPHPNARFRNGQNIKAVVRSRDRMGRINLTHKELLGTWAQNAALFEVGQTVPGIIRSVERYGVFVELRPNLAGLAECSEGVEAGQCAGVYIKNILPEKMKIKLVVVDAFRAEQPPSEHEYFIESGHIDYWRYSPPECDRIIESIF